MKICGFTFIRNAVKFDYPVIASITSILPIVDKFIVSVGNCNDGTLQLIESINSPKIQIVHSVWDESLKEGGRVLASETDKALAQVSQEYEWAFYLQADEVVHEKDLPTIFDAATKYADNKNVDGLLFNYKHFYGTYDYIGDSRRWYKNEIRIVRNNNNVVSYRDAQGFRNKQNKKLRVKKIDASIYHYGWVRHPHEQLKKYNNFSGLWNGIDYQESVLTDKDQYDYFSNTDSIDLFKGTHPAVMHKRIAEKNWHIDLDTSQTRFSFKDKLLHKLEKLTGKRFFGYKNYRII